MKIINPHTEALSIRFKGVGYSVDAESEVSGIPEDVAKYWKLMLHNFIEIVSEGEEVAPIKEESKEEVKPADEAPVASEEVLEEEVVEEKTKASKKSK